LYDDVSNDPISLTGPSAIDLAFTRTEAQAREVFAPASSMGTATGTPNLAAAVGWVSDTLLGGLGSSIAILAIAGVGVAMLQGRLPARRGFYCVLGCFILFGAPSIAQALMTLARGSQQTLPAQPVIPPAPAAAPSPPPTNNDPYAGASVPML
jgi:type IV secretory pathway VirB2 component (pilin)